MNQTMMAKELWSRFCNGDQGAGWQLCTMVGGHTELEWDGFESLNDQHGMFCCAQWAAGELGAIEVIP